MIIPSRWFSGGKGLDSFRKEMLADRRIRELHDYFNSADCFPGIDLSGGVCYFLWDRDNRGKCKITSYRSGIKTQMERPLLKRGTSTFIRFNEAVTILEKVHSPNFLSFANYVSPRKPFGIETSTKVKEVKSAGDIKIYAYPKNGYSPLNKIKRNFEWINKYKVLCAKLMVNAVIFLFSLSNLLLVNLKHLLKTYIVLHLCSEIEARNVISYIKTRVFRFWCYLKVPKMQQVSLRIRPPPRLLTSMDRRKTV